MRRARRLDLRQQLLDFRLREIVLDEITREMPRNMMVPLVMPP
jgi:hypothetical protein